MGTATVSLQTAAAADLERVLPMVRAAHALEGVQQSEAARRAAVAALLADGGPGRIWLLRLDDETIGYAAVCFGYSIEFGGRDGFVDEVFILPPYRGRGHGRDALAQLLQAARALGVRALHLEVARDNEAAQRLYRSAGFAARERYCLMTARLDDQANGPADPQTA